MTKKEFKQKCKAEKATSYKLSLAGTIFALVGLTIVLATMFLIRGSYLQIIGFVLGGILAVVGIVLDIMGEVKLAQDFKTYQQ